MNNELRPHLVDAEVVGVLLNRWAGLLLVPGQEEKVRNEIIDTIKELQKCN